MKIENRILNEVKKELYKKNPVAVFLSIRKGISRYVTSVKFSEEAMPINILFEIPVGDMGDASFTAEMDSKLLIRWISVEDNE